MKTAKDYAHEAKEILSVYLEGITANQERKAASDIVDAILAAARMEQLKPATSATEVKAIDLGKVALLEAAKEFVARVEKGEIQSRHSYVRFKSAIAVAEYHSCEPPLLKQ